MRLNKIKIHNFKCYDDLEIDHLHSGMNIFIGNNGTGKSSLLEAIRILIGSLYYGFDKYDSKLTAPSISNDNVKLSYINKSLEPQIPCWIAGTADFDGRDISWTRIVETLGGKTKFKDSKDLQQLSKEIQESVRNGESKDLPLVAFFSTERYTKEKFGSAIKTTGSRMQGYFNALDTATNIKTFLDIFYTETLDQLQNETPSVLLHMVTETVKECMRCDTLKYMLKIKQLLVGYEGDQPMPFSMLSDGVRGTLAMVMELAIRCYLLNPHLGVDAPKATKGVVLIDEVDLHLHPSWQTHILNDLRRAFPQIQFIITTHAPLVISQISDCCLYSIAERQIFDFPNQNGRDINYIVEQMHVPSMKENVKEMLDKYLGMIDAGRGKDPYALKLRLELEEMLGKDHAELHRADMLLSFF